MAIARLDVLCGSHESRGDMNRTLCSTLLVAAAALAGCNQSDGDTSANEAQANAANAAAPLQLPPSIAHSRIYRCKDNSVVYIDWLSDNKSANFRADKNASPTQMVAPEAGQKMVGPEGYSLTGTFADASVTLERPGKGAQACKA
jgi:hypothetical protein